MKPMEANERAIKKMNFLRVRNLPKMRPAERNPTRSTEELSSSLL
jgi:hypothetical protein